MMLGWKWRLENQQMNKKYIHIFGKGSYLSAEEWQLPAASIRNGTAVSLFRRGVLSCPMSETP